MSVSAGVRGCQLVLAPDDLARITEATYGAIATPTK
jgi:prolyl-tRNA editing enzyme YbaK/EbsC (Cys-tRNA(Pro) deacylase)